MTPHGFPLQRCRTAAIVNAIGSAIWVLGVAWALLGCGGPPPLPALPPTRAGALPEEFGAQPRIPNPAAPLHGRPGSLAENLPDERALRDGVSVDEAVRVALHEDPTLRELAAEARALEAESRQAGAWSNPRFSYEVEGVNVTEFDAGATIHEMRFEQVFDLGGVHDSRASEVYAQAMVAWIDHYHRRWQLARQVERWFVELALSESDYGRLVDVRSRLLDVLSRAVAAGRTDEAALRALNLLIATQELDLDDTWGALTADRQHIVTAMAVPEAWVGPIEATRLDLAFERRLAQSSPDMMARALFNQNTDAALAGNLDVKRAAWEVGVAHEGILVANSASWPDLSVYLAVQFSGNTQDVFIKFGFTIPIPIFDRNRDAERAALARVDAAIERFRGTAREVMHQLADVCARIATNVQKGEKLSSSLLPQSRDNFDAIAEDWLAGRRASYLEVLEAARTWIDLTHRAIDAERLAQLAAFDARTILGPTAPDIIDFAPSGGEPDGR